MSFSEHDLRSIVAVMRELHVREYAGIILDPLPAQMTDQHEDPPRKESPKRRRSAGELISMQDDDTGT